MTNQETENIRAKGLATIISINANATSEATKVLNRGSGQVSKQDIEYTAKAMKAINADIQFTETADIMEYYFYQKLGALKSDTKNKLVVGADVTFIDAGVWHLHAWPSQDNDES